jgi:hypothetical protein
MKLLRNEFETFPLGRTWAMLLDHERDRLTEFFRINGTTARVELDAMAEAFIDVLRDEKDNLLRKS